MATIPVNDSIHIHADRRSVFEMLMSFGDDAPGFEDLTRVLSKQRDRVLVETRTQKCGVVGGCNIYRTVEWVSGHEPDRVDFDTVEGPLTMMQDHITLEEQGGCTLLRYERECGLWGWLAGWAMMVPYVRPVKQRFIRAHLDELKETIEARAKRSRVYPQQPCEMETIGSSQGA